MELFVEGLSDDFVAILNCPDKLSPHQSQSNTNVIIKSNKL
jgi:hypothetical protein